MINDNTDIVDPDRSAHLCDVGLRGYTAAAVVSADGATYLVLARHDALGKVDIRYDAKCTAVDHEQIGPLPLEYVRRMTVSRRRQRTEGGDQ